MLASAAVLRSVKCARPPWAPANSEPWLKITAAPAVALSNSSSRPPSAECTRPPCDSMRALPALLSWRKLVWPPAVDGRPKKLPTAAPAL